MVTARSATARQRAPPPPVADATLGRDARRDARLRPEDTARARREAEAGRGRRLRAERGRSRLIGAAAAGGETPGPECELT